MLKKINRIGEKKEFGEVKNNGRMINGFLFGLIWQKQTEGKKVGMVVSKKISKLAAERNRIKRLVAEAVRRNLEKLPDGFRGIFLVKREMLGKKYDEVEEKLLMMLKSLK